MIPTRRLLAYLLAHLPAFDTVNVRPSVVPAGRGRAAPRLDVGLWVKVWVRVRVRVLGRVSGTILRVGIRVRVRVRGE